MLEALCLLCLRNAPSCLIGLQPHPPESLGEVILIGLWHSLELGVGSQMGFLICNGTEEWDGYQQNNKNICCRWEQFTEEKEEITITIWKVANNWCWLIIKDRKNKTIIRLFHQSNWQKFKFDNIQSHCIEKKVLQYIGGGNLNWYTLLEGQLSSSYQNFNCEYSLSQQSNF